MDSFRRLRSGKEKPPEDDLAEAVGAADLQKLASTFTSPPWLSDLGRMSWYLVGFFLLLAGLTWLLGTTYTIVGPVVAGTIVATVAMPLVNLLQQRRFPRAAGAGVVLLLLVAIAVVIGVIVIGGITSQSADIAKEASAAADKLESWLKSVGVNSSGASSANHNLSSSIPDIITSLTKGVISGIRGIASLAFALSFLALSTFFLLKDGPSMRSWVDRHLGVPQPIARTITGGIIRSLRGYFRGVTLVAAFNGVVVTIGALILGVPLAGTIGVVTLVTAYVPYIGAFVAGAFAVVIALGAKGTATALVMLVIVILANGLLQNIVQPFAMGSALDLHPLAVLIITISAGCVFGMIGLVLAAPLTSAAVHITRDLSAARARAMIAAGEVDDPDPPPLAAPTTG